MGFFLSRPYYLTNYPFGLIGPQLLRMNVLGAINFGLGLRRFRRQFEYRAEKSTTCLYDGVRQINIET